ncbi:hypothetical protein [Pseudoxanthomonas putridarboris]|uniref:Uncharacterized protein n=1 Tax=Pseudoxanthomonas putridarboris TaxID=752605 RepID=A0ABU9IYS8_9GAMM
MRQRHAAESPSVVPPCVLLLVTGPYMFALPYANKWRSSGRGG